MQFQTLRRLPAAIASAVGTCYVRFAHCMETHPLLTPILLSGAVNLLLEILGRRSVLQGFSHLFLHPYIFFINALIVFVTLTPAYLCARRSFVCLCVSLGWLILGITNCILLGMRNTPLAAIDFGLIVSCFGIITVYLNLAQILAIAAGILCLLIVLVRLFQRTPCRPLPRMSRVRGLAAVGASGGTMALLLLFSFHINAFTTEFPDLAGAYADYGFAYCFSLSVLDRGIDRPDTYSGDEIDEILQVIDSAPVEGTDAVPETAPLPEDSVNASSPFAPNIIFVQLESFFDVKRLEGVTFSEDPTPVFTTLREAGISGYLSVPSIGAGTANTEFEILSGMNLDDFGAGEYPYKTILRQTTCESLAYNLRALGYTAHALHNNTGTFYERHRVYSTLGFDVFVPLEYMQNVTYNPLGWADDAVLTAEIRRCLDSTAGEDFIFAVSVQPHGKYPDSTEETTGLFDAYDLPSLLDQLFDNPDEDEADALTSGHLTGNVTAVLNQEELAAQKISVSGIADEKLAAQYTYYVNQLYETDAFIGALIADLSASEEDTVLILYGDHLPCFHYTDADFADGSTPYNTEYVIWSNFGLEGEDRDLQAYQLSAYVQHLLGMSEGTITRLHQTYFAEEDTAAAAEPYLEALELLEYDMLYGERVVWDGYTPYLPTDLRMGSTPVTISGIQIFGTSMYIRGENFTPFSCVRINGDVCETVFLDAQTLLVSDTVIGASGAEITVFQAGADGIVLGECPPVTLTPTP